MQYNTKQKIMLAIVCCALLVIAFMGGQEEPKDKFEGSDRFVGEAIEFITKDGIKVELLEIEASDNVLDIYFNLRDMVGHRLDGGIYFTPFIGNRSDEIASSTSPAEIIGRTDDGIVTLHSRHILDRSVEGQELYFTIERIYYTLEIDEDVPIEYNMFEYFTADKVIEVEWIVVFEAENKEMYLVADRLHIGYKDYIIREIRVNPLALLVIAESDMTTEIFSPEVKVVTENGVVATVSRAVSSRSRGGFIGRTYTEFRLSYEYIDEDFLDLDSVISIEIGGETIYFR